MNPALADTPLPAKVKVVCWGAIIFGALAFIGMLISLIQSNIDINFAGLLLPAGLIMLTRRSDGWRKCALVLYWIIVIAIPLIVLLGLTGNGVVTVEGGPVGAAIGVLIGLAFWGFILWSLAVLHAAPNRRYFRHHPADLGALL